MRVQKTHNNDGFVEYYFIDYEAPEDFYKIDKKIRKLKRLKVKIIEKIEGFSFLKRHYSVMDSEIFLINEHMSGNYLTVERKKDEKVLEVIIDYLKEDQV
jgi:hypothetical protein